MDDRTSSRTASRVLVAVAGSLVLVLTARALFGDPGVAVALLVVLVPLCGFAYEQLSERPLPRPALRAARGPAARPAPVEDAWRSERWIGQAVERGLRELDDWRLGQQA